MAGSAKSARKHSADRMMHNVASTLIRDFQENLNDPLFASDFLGSVLTQDIKRIRETAPAYESETDIYRFKSAYQLSSLYKRYRCQNDIYSDDELTVKAIDTFLNTQNRLRTLDLDSLPASVQRILDLARSYVTKILGPYSDEEHRSLCRFGRRASVGIPARDACEAARWEIPISGSPEQISWFHSEMNEVECIAKYWQDQQTVAMRPIYHEVDSLKLTLVPKTFKALRCIMPNTTIGSYMSFGLGQIIRKRLRREGYDISSLQERHKVLAQRASINLLDVTVDLSSASDSISEALVERIFPPDWFDILTRSRIGKVTLPNGTVVQSRTFCTMGIGYTFPLQTLVFLSLLKAIEATLFNRLDRRHISVYGDDLIYHRRMHDYVVEIFTQLGFVINVDKTFVTGAFRESCGGDYYHGVDVRPFQPRNGSALVGDKAYEAMLYKYINGLLARWTEHEVKRTLSYLTSEIEKVTGKCKLVPADYPDESGIKCPSLAYWNFLKYAKCAQPKHLGNGVYRFSYLRLVPDHRKELRHEPYLWAALGRSSTIVVDQYDGTDLRASRTAIMVRIDTIVGCDEYIPLLIHKEDVPTKTIRGLSGRRLRRTSTFVTVSHTGRITRQSGTSCFEDRRVSSR